MDALFKDDILSLVGPKPVLFNDLIDTLRGRLMAGSPPSGRRWRNVRPDDVEFFLRDHGAYFRIRNYASGAAVYVATEPFTEVLGRAGRRAMKMWPVDPY